MGNGGRDHSFAPPGYAASWAGLKRSGEKSGTASVAINNATQVLPPMTRMRSRLANGLRGLNQAPAEVGGVAGRLRFAIALSNQDRQRGEKPDADAGAE